jgi:VanZ family protein
MGDPVTIQTESAHNQSFRHDVALAIFAGLLVYATLYPFNPIRLPSADQVMQALRWPRYITQYDVVLNALAYVPLGVFIWLKRTDIGSPMRRVVIATAAGVVLSSFLELLQLFVVTRVASSLDVVANGSGAMIGALALANPIGRTATERIAKLRDERLISGPAAEFAVIMVMLWLIAQSNPSIPFFEAGNINAKSAMVGPLPFSELNTQNAMQQLRLMGIAVTVSGFAFFVSVILRKPRGALRVVLTLVMISLAIKLVTSIAMLQPRLMFEWIDHETILGMVIGLAVFFPVRRVAARLRAYFGILLIAAGALLTKISSFYDAANQVLKVFNWPYGQIDRFTNLTRYIHEMWPIAAFIFLLVLFFRPPASWLSSEHPTTNMKD